MVIAIATQERMGRSRSSTTMEPIEESTVRPTSTRFAILSCISQKLDYGSNSCQWELRADNKET